MGPVLVVGDRPSQCRDTGKDRCKVRGQRDKKGWRLGIEERTKSGVVEGHWRFRNLDRRRVLGRTVHYSIYKEGVVKDPDSDVCKTKRETGDRRSVCIVILFQRVESLLSRF